MSLTKGFREDIIDQIVSIYELEDRWPTIFEVMIECGVSNNTAMGLIHSAKSHLRGGIMKANYLSAQLVKAGYTRKLKEGGKVVVHEKEGQTSIVWGNFTLEEIKG